MIIVHCPNTFFQERKYVLEYVLQMRLGLIVDIVESEKVDEYKCICTNTAKHVVFPDYFWTRVNVSHLNTYLSGQFLPQNISVFEKSGLKYPLYELSFSDSWSMSVRNQKDDEISWDWISVIFFMLTRWEEFVNNQTDKHNRFDGKFSLAYTSGVLHLPIVDFCIENLRILLEKHLGIFTRLTSSFSILPTHDIDNLYRWSGVGTWFKEIVGDIVVRKSIKTAKSTFRAGLQVSATGRDPYYTLELYLQMAAEQKLKAVFNLMVDKLCPYDDADYTAFLHMIIQMLKHKKQIVGLHASYLAGQNREVFLHEVKKMEMYQGEEFGARSHYLRTRVPEFMQWCHDAGITWDSSLFYASIGGFRCGTCHPFPYFNFVTSTQLSVFEWPLLIMDTTWVEHQQLTVESALQEAIRLKRLVRELRGQLNILWHNTSWNSDTYKPYRGIYQYLIAANEF